MFKGDEDTFESLVDKLASFCVGDEQPEPGRQTSAHNAMQVAALSKGGKSRSGKGKSVTCWVCNKQITQVETGSTTRTPAKAKGSQAKRQTMPRLSASTVEAVTPAAIALPTKVNKSGEGRHGNKSMRSVESNALG